MVAAHGRNKMNRTTITKTASDEVTLTATDPISGDPISWVFWTPTNGGYVRKGEHHTADDKQVCKALDNRGSTLWATDGDDLLAVIRREWAAYRKLVVVL